MPLIKHWLQAVLKFLSSVKMRHVAQERLCQDVLLPRHRQLTGKKSGKLQT